MNELDFERPHGRIIGPCTVCPGAFYTQDGHFFDSYGKSILINEEQNHGEGNEERSNVEINDDGQGQDVGQEKANEENQENDEVVLTSSLVSDLISEPIPTPQPIPESEPTPVLDVVAETAMTLTDKELKSMSEEGMQALRDYAAIFGVKGRSKDEIIKELKALRE